MEPLSPQQGINHPFFADAHQTDPSASNPLLDQLRSCLDTLKALKENAENNERRLQTKTVGLRKARAILASQEAVKADMEKLASQLQTIETLGATVQIGKRLQEDAPLSSSSLTARPLAAKRSRSDRSEGCYLSTRSDLIHLYNKLYQKRDETGDVAFKFKDGCYIKAHQFILREISCRFDELFKEVLQMKQESEILTIDCEEGASAAFEKILQFVYTDRWDLSDLNKLQQLELYNELMIFAERYAMHKLLKKGMTFLESLTIDDIMKLIRNLEKIKGEDRCSLLIEKKINQFLCLNAFHFFIKHPENLRYLSKERLISLLQQDQLLLEEENVAQIVANWLTIQAENLIEADAGTAPPLISALTQEITPYVRLPLISRDSLFDKWIAQQICGCPVFSQELVRQAANRSMRQAAIPRMSVENALHPSQALARPIEVDFSPSIDSKTVFLADMLPAFHEMALKDPRYAFFQGMAQANLMADEEGVWIKFIFPIDNVRKEEKDMWVSLTLKIIFSYSNKQLLVLLPMTYSSQIKTGRKRLATHHFFNTYQRLQQISSSLGPLKIQVSFFPSIFED